MKAYERHEHQEETRHSTFQADGCPKTRPRTKRFHVALTFPGGKRRYVGKVAKILADELGNERVFYDEFFQPELARIDLDVYLQQIYHDDSELIVVFLSKEYAQKEWCGLEWRAIRDLIMQRKVSEIMLLRFDDTKINGLFSIDGYADISQCTPENAARLIIARHKLIEENSRHLECLADTTLPFKNRFDAFVERLRVRYRPYEAKAQALTDPLRIYIPLRCRSIHPSQDKPQDALDWARNGLRGTKGQLLVADYGEGKSFFALKLFLLLASTYQSDPDNAPIPILFPLNRHRLRQAAPEAILEDIYSFLSAQNFPLSSWEDLKSNRQSGRLVFILDGVDEINLATTYDPIDLLRRLDMTQHEPCSWIATSRKGIFAHALAQPQCFGEFQVAELVTWDCNQWSTYVNECDRLGAFAGWKQRDSFLAQIAKWTKLKELTVTPLYARMLVEVSEQILEIRDIDIIQLYETYSDFVLAGREDTSHVRSIEMRRQCLESVAVHLFRNNKDSITEKELACVARAYVHEVSDDELLGFVKLDLQNYSLLNCDERGEFRFSHKSFFEFFLARAVFREIEIDIETGQIIWRAILREKDVGMGECKFLAALIVRSKNGELLADDINRILRQGPSAGTETLRRNLVAIKLYSDRDLEDSNLQDLKLSGLDFSKCNLRGAYLTGAKMIGVDLSGANMAGCILAQTNLSRSRLAGANLENASLNSCTLKNCDLSGDPPVLTGARFRRVKVSRNELAYLNYAVNMSPDKGSWKQTALRELKSCRISISHDVLPL